MITTARTPASPERAARPDAPGVWSFLAELLLDPVELVGAARDWRRERRARQRARVSKITCALRIVDGAVVGLGRRWARGAARVPPGAVVFEPDSWRRSRTRIAVRSATLQPPGDLAGRRLRRIGPRPRLIVLETAQGTLEWLVPEEQLQRALGVTRPSVTDAVP